MLSGFSPGLQILPPTMTAQFFLAAEKLRLRFFQKFLQNLLKYEKFHNIEFPKPIVGCCQSTLRTLPPIVVAVILVVLKSSF